MNVCITSMFIMLGTDGADRMDFVIALGLIGGFFLVDAALDLYRYARIGDAYTEFEKRLQKFIIYVNFNFEFTVIQIQNFQSYILICF